MVYEISQEALAVMTMEQLEALKSLTHWDASKIVLRDDGETRPGSQHGDGHMLLGLIYREKEKVGEPIFVFGLMPSGSMHS